MNWQQVRRLMPPGLSRAPTERTVTSLWTDSSRAEHRTGRRDELGEQPAVLQAAQQRSRSGSAACTPRGSCCPAWSSHELTELQGPVAGTTSPRAGRGRARRRGGRRRPAADVHDRVPHRRRPGGGGGRHPVPAPRRRRRPCVHRPGPRARSGCSARRTRCSSRSSSTGSRRTACGSSCPTRGTTRRSTDHLRRAGARQGRSTPRAPRSSASSTSCGTPAPRA